MCDVGRGSPRLADISYIYRNIVIKTPKAGSGAWRAVSVAGPVRRVAAGPRVAAADRFGIPPAALELVIAFEHRIVNHFPRLCRWQ